MGTLGMKHFDVLDFMKKSKELGIDEKIAELQARQFKKAIDTAIIAIKNERQLRNIATREK